MHASETAAPAPVIDTHCHLDIVAEQGVPVDQSLENAGEAGVEALVQISTCLKAARFNQQLAKRLQNADSLAGDADQDVFLAARSPAYHWTAGLHPESARDLHELDELFEIARDHRDDPSFLGLGETGLDYFHSKEHIDEQKESFGKHLDLAQELGLPVVVHLRDDRVYDPANIKTAQDALELVRAREGVKGVLHCFTYTEKEAMPFVELGWMVSYSGILTFKNAKTIQDGAAQIPLQNLMVETDAPFLAPMPHRGKTNQPAYVGHTLEFLAQLRAERNGEDPQQVKAQVLQNSRKFLRWKDQLKQN